jgi:copper(I)-binding protein
MSTTVTTSATTTAVSSIKVADGSVRYVPPTPADGASAYVVIAHPETPRDH